MSEQMGMVFLEASELRYTKKDSATNAFMQSVHHLPIFIQG